MQIINLLALLIVSFASHQSGKKGLCGTPIINETLKVYEKYYSKELPNLVLKSPNVKVGDTLSFWVYNFDSEQDYQTAAICRAIGIHAYIFVETTEWDAGIVNQQAVDILIKTFDDSTARDPTKGIYELNTELFGTPPDVDNDSLIYILLLDIKGEGIAGYFWAGNQVCTYPHSNCKEMIYIDTRYEHKCGTIAHEFQHMIHWKHDRDEATWVNEGCSCFAEFWVGDCEWTGRYYLDSTDISLIGWDNTLAHYDKVFLWTLYFYERFGEEAITTLVNRPENSYTGVNGALSQLGYSETFTDVLQDWAIANFVDNPDVSFYEGKYGYINIDVPSARMAAGHFSYPVDDSSTLSNAGVDYINFGFPPDSLNINFNGYNFGNYYRYYVYLLPANSRNDIIQVDRMSLDDNWDGTYSAITMNYNFIFMVVVGGIHTRGYNYSTSTYTGVVESAKLEVDTLRIKLFQNYPNPFNSLTAISYLLPESVGPYRSAVSLRIYDLTGGLVRTLVDECQSPGFYTVRWDGKDDLGRKLSSGVYLYKLSINGKKFDTMKMLLMAIK